MKNNPNIPHNNYDNDPETSGHMNGRAEVAHNPLKRIR